MTSAFCPCDIDICYVERRCILQCVAVCCSVLQCVAVCCSRTWFRYLLHRTWKDRMRVESLIKTHSTLLKHTILYWNTLYFTETHFTLLKHTVKHYNHHDTLGQSWFLTARHFLTLQHTAAHSSTLQHTATHCNTLQHTATHCNILQHTATHFMKASLPRTFLGYCHAYEWVMSHVRKISWYTYGWVMSRIQMSHAARTNESCPSFVIVKWLIRTCDMTHSYVWHALFVCVTWLIHMCDMTHSYVWHDSFIFVTWLICEWQDSFIYVTWLIRICDMPYSYVWMSHVTCASYVWHDSFICVI